MDHRVSFLGGGKEENWHLPCPQFILPDNYLKKLFCEYAQQKECPKKSFSAGHPPPHMVLIDHSFHLFL